MNDSCRVKFFPESSDVEEWFDVLNVVVFKNRLKEKFQTIEIRRRHKIWAEYIGQFYPNEKKDVVCGLKLTNRFPNKKFFVQILAHEMIHHFQFICERPRFNAKNVSHGKSFWKWKPIFKKHGLNLKRIAKAS